MLGVRLQPPPHRVTHRSVLRTVEAAIEIGHRLERTRREIVVANREDAVGIAFADCRCSLDGVPPGDRLPPAPARDGLNFRQARRERRPNKLHDEVTA